MKQVSSDKYSIAWFKLADCIARGEKERALGVYRLLSHSIDDPALVLQLHGDILLSFKDRDAQKKYKEAAQMYQDSDQLLEAAAVYEHLATMNPEKITYRMQLIDLYQQLRIFSKVREYVQSILHYFLDQKKWAEAIELVRNYDTAGDESFAAGLHEDLFFSLISTQDVLLDTKVLHARQALEFWNTGNNERASTEFLKKLEALDEELYDTLLAHITGS